MKIDIKVSKEDVIMTFPGLLEEWGGKAPNDNGHGIMGVAIKELQSAQAAVSQTTEELASEISKLTERKEALETLKPTVTIDDDVKMVGDGESVDLDAPV